MFGLDAANWQSQASIIQQKAPRLWKILLHKDDSVWLENNSYLFGEKCEETGVAGFSSGCIPVLHWAIASRMPLPLIEWLVNTGYADVYAYRAIADAAHGVPAYPSPQAVAEQVGYVECLAYLRSRELEAFPSATEAQIQRRFSCA